MTCFNYYPVILKKILIKITKNLVRIRDTGADLWIMYEETSGRKYFVCPYLFIYLTHLLYLLYIFLVCIICLLVKLCLFICLIHIHFTVNIYVCIYICACVRVFSFMNVVMNNRFSDKIRDISWLAGRLWALHDEHCALKFVFTQACIYVLLPFCRPVKYSYIFSLLRSRKSLV